MSKFSRTVIPGKIPRPFWSLTNTELHAVVRCHVGDVLSFEQNATLSNRAHTRDGSHCCCLAGAVCTNKRNNLAFIHIERDAFNGFNLSVENM